MSKRGSAAFVAWQVHKSHVWKKQHFLPRFRRGGQQIWIGWHTFTQGRGGSTNYKKLRCKCVWGSPNVVVLDPGGWNVTHLASVLCSLLYAATGCVCASDGRRSSALEGCILACGNVFLPRAEMCFVRGE
jgi:hypothetical protein